MDIIVTHDVTDFDALAGAVAAQKLHPEASIVLRGVEASVHDFLALHKDRFRTVGVGEVDQDTVRHLVLVDVRRASRLHAFERVVARAQGGDPTLAVTVYDHHGAAADDVPARHVWVAKVGSASTVLVERMKAERIAIDAVEATLLALGIHEDTGSLTFAGTTGRDAHALGWLFGRGASLTMIQRYLRPAFGRAQRELLVHVMDAVRFERVGKLPIAFATVTLPAQSTGSPR